MKTITPILPIVWLFMLLVSCDLANNKSEPQQQFVAIYENNQSEYDFQPIDVQQTEDKGFLIVSSVVLPNQNFPAAYVLKTDEIGKVQWEKISEQAVSPCSKWIANGQNYFFVAMHKENSGTLLVQADENLTPLASNSALIYPLAANQVAGGIALLSYVPEDAQSIFSVINTNGSPSLSAKYEVYEDVQQKIIDQVSGKGKKYPFFTGQTGSGYMFNGFTNFTHALVFANAGSGTQSGVVNGVRYESALCAAVWLASGKYACVYYDANGNIYMALQAVLNTSAVQSVRDLKGIWMPEIEPYAKVVLRRELILGKSCLLLGTTTKSGQAVLFCFDENSGKLLATKYLGSGTRHELSSWCITSDGGLAILCKVFVAGRYSRLALYKLSKIQAEALTGSRN